jgi:hypothetical protein
MAVKNGDRIVMLGKIKKANARDRAGVIERVLSENPPRYEIRWDDGALTVMAPLPGSISIEPKRARAPRAAVAAKKPAAKAVAAKKPAPKPTAAAKKPAAAKPAARRAR